MLIRCIVDVEKDADMKNLNPKEAITILNDMKIDIPVPKAAVTQRKRNAALDMAISALSCLEIPNNSDTISRQDALDLVTTDKLQLLDADALYMAIEDLPPAEPERKTGKWIEEKIGFRDFVYCSVCEDSYISVPIDPSWNYCPHCGAKMEVDYATDKCG